MKYYKISCGTGSGEQRITAFDDALLNAGVGNYNLVRLSSILPLDAQKKDAIKMPLGSLLPIAYAQEDTCRPGTRVSAAVAIGFPKEVDEEHCAVIMEYEGPCSEYEVRNVVTKMVKEGFKNRGWELDRIDVAASSIVCPEGTTHVTAFACVAEWEE